MIKFKRLRIQGFRSFDREVVFEFPDAQSGFYQLAGDNGAGKSSTWDAIAWCYFGCTMRRVRGDHVENWSGHSLCSVSVLADIDDVEVEVTRTRKPNSLTMRTAGADPVTVEQVDIERVLSGSFNTFHSTVILGQFSRFFIDLSPSEKLEQFTAILDLKKWSDASEKAKLKAKEDEDEVTDIETAIAMLDGRLHASREFRDREKRSMHEWAADQDNLIAELELRWQGIEVEVSEKRSEYEAAVAVHAAQQEKLKTLQADLDALENGSDEEHQCFQAASRDLHKAAAARDSISNELATFKRLVGRTCPACKQDINSSHAKSIIKEFEGRLAPLEATVDKTSTLADEAEAAVSSREDQRAALQKAVKAASDSLPPLLSQAQTAQGDYRLVCRDQEALSEKLAALRNAPNPHEDVYRSLKKEITRLKAEKTEHEEHLAKANTRLDRHQFWAKSFKDVRLWIIEQAVLELEIHTNNSLRDLGLSEGWRVKFDVEKPGSAGVVKGFHTFVTAPGSAEVVPWEAWSGGETQRLRVAGAIGFANLVAGRHGFRSNVEIWDEPTQGLTQEGIDDLLSFLATRAKIENKQIWLVDHRTFTAGDFDRVYVVEKTESGSKIM